MHGPVEPSKFRDVCHFTRFSDVSSFVNLFLYHLNEAESETSHCGCDLGIVLRKAPQSSEECFATAMEAHLSNLDPNMRITTGVVSVTCRGLREFRTSGCFNDAFAGPMWTVCNCPDEEP